MKISTVGLSKKKKKKKKKYRKKVNQLTRGK